MTLVKNCLDDNKPLVNFKNVSFLWPGNNKSVISNCNFSINKTGLWMIVGKNGSGKSTLSKVIAGHPSYKVLSGSIQFKGKNILELEPEERARIGIFLGFQYPVEIPGVSNLEFLRVATNSRRKELLKSELDTFQFEDLVKKRLKIVFHDLKAEINSQISSEIGKPDLILHLAAASHVDRSILYPMEFVQDNVVGTVNLLDFAKKLDELERFVYFSTDEIFGNAPEGVSYKEYDRYNSTNPYSASKASAEEFCVAYENTYKLPVHPKKNKNAPEFFKRYGKLILGNEDE
mgnify:CR=1 FL=1